MFALQIYGFLSKYARDICFFLRLLLKGKIIRKQKLIRCAKRKDEYSTFFVLLLYFVTIGLAFRSQKLYLCSKHKGQ